jgi:hypothetical protein
MLTASMPQGSPHLDASNEMAIALTTSSALLSPRAIADRTVPELGLLSFRMSDD